MEQWIEAFDEGYIDALQGKSVESNPHKDARYIAWFKGFAEATEKIRDAKTRLDTHL